MSDIKVLMLTKEGFEKVSFIIEIPYFLLINTSFMETMQKVELSNSVKWLRTLADELELMERNKHV